MLIVDSGPLVAAAATRDRNQERGVDLLSNAEGPLLVPTLVVTEVTYFLADRIGAAAERAFANALRGGELLCEPVDPADWSRIVEVLDEHADAEIAWWTHPFWPRVSGWARRSSRPWTAATSRSCGRAAARR